MAGNSLPLGKDTPSTALGAGAGDKINIGVLVRPEPLLLSVALLIVGTSFMERRIGELGWPTGKCWSQPG